MGDIKKLVGLCVGFLMMIIGSIALATPAQAVVTKVINSNGSGSFVSANFDFDHANLSTPAANIQSEGTSDAGPFTSHGVDEFAADKNTCTVPGGVAGAGMESKLVGDVSVSRFTATGDLMFLKSTSGTECEDFSTFPTPPFAFILTETGIVTGGTGAYSGATGTFTFKVEGAVLSLDAGVGFFGWFTDTGVTTVTVQGE
jgi:hypothetical protein